MTDKEFPLQGDLLPPWKQHPELENGSIGWRMGYGEGYMVTWWNWSSTLSAEQLIEYFKKYLPIPFEWLGWVARHCGRDNYDYSETREFAEIRWLEQQGLANFSEFMSWYQRDFSREGYLSSLKTIPPSLVIPTATNDLLNRLFNIMHIARTVKELTDEPLNTQKVSEFMTTIDRTSLEILYIVNALQIHQEHPDL